LWDIVDGALGPCNRPVYRRIGFGPGWRPISQAYRNTPQSRAAEVQESAVAVRCVFRRRFVEVGPEAPVAAALITKGAQLLVVQNHKATSVDLAPTGRADLMERYPCLRRNGPGNFRLRLGDTFPSQRVGFRGPHAAPSAQEEVPEGVRTPRRWSVQIRWAARSDAAWVFYSSKSPERSPTPGDGA
jgi:hypothetical protein